MNAINIPAPEATASIVGHWIGGRLVAAAGRTQEVFNPATGEVTRHVALATSAEVEQAIQAAPAGVSRPGPIRRRCGARACCSNSSRC